MFWLPEMPDDVLQIVIETVTDKEGLCAAKQLRAMARVCKMCAQAARSHPDNQTMPELDM